MPTVGKVVAMRLEYLRERRGAGHVCEPTRKHASRLQRMVNMRRRRRSSDNRGYMIAHAK